ncbi:MAG: hypothetical protein JWN61_3190 [Pseudonocardiales bacterium]|nr:hypothetical protein [Pseudonocardiales bacterium]
MSEDAATRGDAILVQVRFALDQEDGWPPQPDEMLWAQPLGEGRYVVETPPWYVRSLAVDDVVAAEVGADGALWAGGVLRQGGRLTVRLLPLPDGPLGGDPEEVRLVFAPLGVRSGTPSPEHGIVALDIPGDGDLRAIKALLIAGESDGSWDVDESRVSDAWIVL